MYCLQNYTSICLKVSNGRFVRMHLYLASIKTETIFFKKCKAYISIYAGSMETKSVSYPGYESVRLICPLHMQVYCINQIANINTLHDSY